MDQAKKTRKAELQKISREELDKALRDHAKWLKAGMPANGRGRANFTRIDLQGVNLRNRDLRGAIFIGANLRGADLRNAKLQEADLDQADLTKANLALTKLRHAKFQHADLSGALHIDVSQLCGMDLSATILPTDIARFDVLKTVDEAAKKGSHLFTLLLLLCLFSWLTVGFEILVHQSNNLAAPFPNAFLKEEGFRLVGPVFILGIFFYFQLYLQRLWEQLMKLPAIFPDGSTLDKKAHPWLPIGFARAHIELLRNSVEKMPFVVWQTRIIELLIYGIAPITVGLFWFKGLQKEKEVENFFQLMLTWITFLLSINFYVQARRTLRRNSVAVFPIRINDYSKVRICELIGYFLRRLLHFIGNNDWQITLMGWLTALLALIHFGVYKTTKLEHVVRWFMATLR